MHTNINDGRRRLLQSSPKVKDRKTRPKPGVAFFRVLFLLAVLIAFSFLNARLNSYPKTQSSTFSKRSVSPVTNEECRFVHRAEDKCAFVRNNCDDEEAGFISYLTFYYCTWSKFKSAAFVVIALWMATLFSTIGIAASDFFSINLSTIAALLGLSENFAGVTFLAFGNGSPDVFSTFAAMNSNSGSLAIGELIGAAGFITTVVAGSMAFVRPFTVAKKSFIRDVAFFTVAAGFALGFLADGHLHLWECVVMVGIYAFYVAFVCCWHWWFSRRKRMRRVEAAARSQHIIPGSEIADLGEEYRDDDEDRDARDISRSDTGEDFSALERASVGFDPDDTDAQERLMGRISSKMRITRPKANERPSHNPIRPSLVGALEFRSVYFGLEQSRNMQSYALHPPSRRYSDDPTLMGSQEVNNTRAADDASTNSATNRPEISRTASGNRMRAVSAVEPGPSRDRFFNSSHAPRIDLLEPLPSDNSPPQQFLRPPAGNVSGHLAPNSPTISISPPPSEISNPDSSLQLTEPQSQPSSNLLAPPDKATTKTQTTAVTRGGPHLQVKTDDQSLAPNKVPSSQDITQGTNHNEHVGSRPTSPLLRPLSQNLDDIPVECRNDRPWRYWPQYMPHPYTLLSTLFPTLTGWKTKSHWERAIGVVAAPSVFLLTITLPVVEMAREGSEPDDDIPNLSLPGTYSNVASSSQSRIGDYTDINGAATSPRSEGHPLAEGYAEAIGPHGPSATVTHTPNQQSTTSLITESHFVHTPEQLPSSVVTTSDHDTWNRWLVILQIFTAPMFIVIILWANMDIDNPRALIRPVLISLLISLLLLAFVISTTTADRTPKWHPVLCFLGFMVSIAWISTIAGEVVGVLKTLGVILNISDAILGLTIFAVGNSLGDLVADITVAKLGFPVMALSACFGGPMLNILLGIGFSGMWMTIKSAKEREHKHPDKKFKVKPYIIEVDRTLIISGVALLVTLVGLLVVVPMRKWKMDRKVGWGLIGLWVVSTVGNVALEMWSGGVDG